MLLIYAAVTEILHECSNLPVPLFPFLKKSGAARNISRIMIPGPFLELNCLKVVRILVLAYWEISHIKRITVLVAGVTLPALPDAVVITHHWEKQTVRRYYLPVFLFKQYTWNYWITLETH